MGPLNLVGPNIKQLSGYTRFQNNFVTSNSNKTERSYKMRKTYHFGTKQWGLWPSYALPSVLHRSIFANGFIYTAGGKDTDDAYIQKIFKMEPRYSISDD